MIMSRISGSFTNQEDKRVYVTIFSKNKTLPDIDIDTSNDTFFDASPVTIEWGLEDTLQTVIGTMCSVRLLTKRYLGDYIYHTDYFDTCVNVVCDGKILFTGFLEPKIYSQSFNGTYNVIELQAYDYLALLKELDFEHDPSGKYTFTPFKNFLGNDIYCLNKLNIRNMFDPKIKEWNVNIDLVNDTFVYYDNSKTLIDGGNIFDKGGCFQNIFYDVDDNQNVTSSNNFEVLDSILKYMNLHIIQYDGKFCIFDWNSLKNRDKKQITFTNIIQPTKTFPLGVQQPVNISDIHYYASNDTNISMTDIHGGLNVNCTIKTIDFLFDSPFDKEKLTSPYRKKDLYMQEIYTNNLMFFPQMLLFLSWPAYISLYDWYKASGIVRDKDYVRWNFARDWYCKIKENKDWIFTDKDGDDIYQTQLYDNTGALKDQYGLFDYMSRNSLVAALASFGCTDNICDYVNKGTQPEAPEMNDYIVISVNGDSEGIDTLPNTRPLVKYNKEYGLSLSSLDDTIQNYIVFSGNILLSPIIGTSNYHSEWKPEQNDWVWTLDQLDDSQCAKGSGFYDTVFLNTNHETGEITRAGVVDTPTGQTLERYLLPSGDMMLKKYKFNYSSQDSREDTVNKVPVLACTLKVGDKYLVEDYVSVVEEGKQINKRIYVWKKLSEIKPDADGYKNNTFTLGFDPTIDDYIIGQEYEITNTVDASLNIGKVKGLAIPISKQDTLSGLIEFQILGPVHTTWNNIVNKGHKWWERKDKWSETDVDLMSEVGTIYIKNFECKLYTDNGGTELDEVADLIYTDTERDAKNKVDVDFNLSTQLNAKEAFEYKVKNTVNLSNIFELQGTKEVPITGIKDVNTNKTGKGEVLYIDNYYDEYTTPKLIFDATMHDVNYHTFTPFELYQLDYLQNKKFYPIGLIKDVLTCTTKVTLKEV